MKLLYYGLIIVIIIVVAYLTFSQRKKQASVTAAILPNPAKNSPDNPYQGLRARIFTLRPSDLGLALPAEKETAFGAVAELGTEQGTATIMSLITGDASMYTSSGGGIIGGTSHQSVKKAAIEFVNTSQLFFSTMQRADTSLPAVGQIKFYVLTNKNIYYCEGPESEITNVNSEWAELFSKSNNLITQLRLTAEK